MKTGTIMTSSLMRKLAAGCLLALATFIAYAAPTVSLSAPANNAVYAAPATVTLSATASAGSGRTIAKVDFYDGATLIATDTTAPYSVTWSNVPAGTHTLTAKATDNKNSATTSTAVTIVVDTPPTVSLTAPAANTVFTAPANISLTATAADADGTVTKVDFYQGSSLLGTATAAPYTFTWTNAPAGSYNLTVKATDNKGIITTSAAVPIKVNTAPAVALTAPAANTVFTAPATISIAANASDSDGSISKVDFYQGSTLLGTATAAPYTFTWANAPAGSYTLTAKATDNNGAVTTSALLAITVDAPPTVAIASPAANAVFSAPASILIAANAADSDGTVSKVDFYQGSTLLGTATSAPYTFTWANAPAGSYSLTVKATDNNGVVSTSAAIPVKVNALPVVTITAPATSALFNAPAAISITANASDSDGSIAKVDFYQGGTLLGTATAAPYAFTWANAPAGSYTLTAKASDNDGGVSTSAPVNVTVNAPPTVSLTTPAANAVFNVPANVTLTANAADSDGTISKVEFYQGSTLLGTATSAPYTFTWANAPAGIYTLTARATDNNGAITLSAPVTITIDTPPAVAITNPVANAIYNAPASITIAASATDSDGTITKVDFYQGGTLLGTSTTAPYAFTWTNVPAGNYAITAQATDNNGVISTSAAIPVTVNAPPTVELTSPANNQILMAPASVTIAASAADSDGSISKVDFYQGSTLLGSATAAPYAFIWNNIQAGTYTLTAQATDNNGATATSAPVTLILDIPPSVTLASPANNQHFTAPATIAMTATASDSDGSIAKVEFYQGTALLGTATSAPYAYTWTNVGEGSYTLTAKATDNGGAETWSAATTVIVDPAAAKLYYLHTDHLDTPRLVTDEANRIVWRNLPLNEPFGNSPPEEDPDGDGQNFSMNLRFPGQYADKETNTNYNYYRDYDPATGRYIQSDPIGLEGGINTYLYVGGRSLELMDFFGLANFVSPLENVGVGIAGYSSGGGGGGGAAPVGVAARTSPSNLNPTQSRNEMSGSLVRRLEKDMRQNGYNENCPIDVQRVPGSNRFDIINGHHRAAAASRANLPSVPIVIWESP